MSYNFPLFNAKILLFGEYTLMLGSRALIIPFPLLGGRFEFSNLNTPAQRLSNKFLIEFFGYLKKHYDEFPSGLDLNLNRFESDIAKGLYLNSDVPQGYGTGSSGVLVAAVFSEYAKKPVRGETTSELLDLKKIFSFMESFFHGKSSGLDPLCCYTGRSILVSSHDKIEIVEFPVIQKESDIHIFLTDSETTSKTGNLVNSFLEKANQKEFRQILEGNLIPRNNNCIDSILTGNSSMFFDELAVLSKLQLDYFDEMIPEKFKIDWQYGISSGDFFLKLCGSGGGGFILGFTEDIGKTKRFFAERNRNILLVNQNSKE